MRGGLLRFAKVVLFVCGFLEATKVLLPRNLTWTPESAWKRKHIYKPPMASNCWIQNVNFQGCKEHASKKDPAVVAKCSVGLAYLPTITYMNSCLLRDKFRSVNIPVPWMGKNPLKDTIPCIPIFTIKIQLDV